MKYPKVSIIIPVYNGEKYLESTIKSCLSQDYQNIEVIVIDDGSTDGSETIVNQYGEKIHYIINPLNLGMAKTFNKAAPLATGEFLLFLGQDDMLPKNHISSLISEFERDTCFVYCNSIIIDSEGSEIRNTYNDEKQMNKDIYFELCLRNIISSTGLIIRKKAFLQVGGWDESYRNFGEWLLWIKLLSVGKVKYTTNSKSYYRVHETNITKSFSSKDTNKELEDYYKVCRNLARNNFKNRMNFKYYLLMNMYDILRPVKKRLNKTI